MEFTCVQTGPVGSAGPERTVVLDEAGREVGRVDAAGTVQLAEGRDERDRAALLEHVAGHSDEDWPSPDDQRVPFPPLPGLDLDGLLPAKG